MKPVRIVIFAKAPLPGLAKTRLIPALGRERSARLARRMLDHTLVQALAVPGVDVELCVSPAPEGKAWAGFAFPATVVVVGQGEGDLGARLCRAAVRIFEEGACPVFIGTDCPTLDSARLAWAVHSLDRCDAFMYGTSDGGYALLALGRPVADLFSGIDWSTNRVFRQTLARIRNAGLSLELGEVLNDIDGPADLANLRKEWFEEI